MNDGKADSNTATVNIKVSANSPPSAADDAYSVSEGGSATGDAASGVLANDTDAEGESLTAILVSKPIHGVLQLASDGSFSYTHDGGETTADSFTYKANDGTSDSNNVATVNISITPINDPPAAEGESYTVTEGQTLNVAAPGLLANDTDAEKEQLTAVLVSKATNGTVVLSGDGSFVYIHNGSETTADSFEYNASDGKDDSNIVAVSIKVTPVNGPPIARNDAYKVAAGGVLSVNGVLGNDTDAEGDPLTATVVTGPTNGVLRFSANGSFNYEHDGSQTTGDSFTYKANDGTADSNVATVNIAVTSVNDPPVAKTDSYTVAEGSTLNLSAPGVLVNDTDPENQLLTAVLVSNPTNGTVVLKPNGSLVYTHNGSETVSDSFTYKARDGLADSNIAIVVITVTPVNDLPIANPDTYGVPEGGILNIAAPGVLANDTDPEQQKLAAVKVSNPTSGTLTFRADGSFTYAHNGSETATDSFTYKVNDGAADSNIATVTINVKPLNDPPVANKDAYAIPEGVSRFYTANIGVLVNDTDPDSPGLTAVLVSKPTRGVLVLNSDGSFRYTHNGGETTEDIFTYKANDGAADSNTVEVHINVTPVNDPPVAKDDTYRVASSGTVTPDASSGVLANDFDAEKNPLTVSLVGTVSNGTLTLNGNGSFSYTHNGSLTTTDSFSYKANDGESDSNIATVTIYYQRQ